MSGHAGLHALGFFISGLSTIAGVLVFARRFHALGHGRWVAYLVAPAVAAPLLIVLSGAIMRWGGVIVALAGAVMFGWVGAVPTRVAAELRKEPSGVSPG